MAQCNQNAQIDSELCTDWRSHNHYESLKQTQTSLYLRTMIRQNAWQEAQNQSKSTVYISHNRNFDQNCTF